MNNQPSRISDLQTWVSRLRSAAAATLHGRGAETASDFADEAGHRRLVDEPLLAWRRQRAGASDGRAVHAGTKGVEPVEVALWRALLDTKAEPAKLIPAADQQRLPIATPILQRPAAIEVATEAELCALHALWWHAGRSGDPTLLERCRESARWMIEHIQPDNATNHPWGLHVFVALAGEIGADSEHYAATMLHNCQVSLGRPDLLSAYVLADAADALVTLEGFPPLPPAEGLRQTGEHPPAGP